MKHDTSSRASVLLRKASPAFEPSSQDRAQARAAIRRRVAVGIAASAAVSATAKTAAAAPSMAPAAVAGAGVATAGTAASTTLATGAGIGFATKIVAAVAILGTVSAGAVTVHRASHAAPTVTVAENKTKTETATETEEKTAAKIAPVAVSDVAPLPVAMPNVDVSPVEASPVAPLPVVWPVSPPKVDRRPPTSDLRPTTIDNQPSASDARPTPSLQTAAEVDLFQRAQEALHAGNPNLALSLLDEHATKYPNGAFAEERQAARVIALCDAGRIDEARTEASSFTSAHPSSPFSARVHESCAARPLTP